MQRDRSDIQYIRYSYEGTAARKPEFRLPSPGSLLPRPVRKPKTVLRIDPLALAAVVLSVVMAVVLCVGMVELEQVRSEQRTLQRYVWDLEDRNEVLEQKYGEQYDLNEVRQAALGMGMVPADQLPHEALSVTIPQEPETPNIFQRLADFFRGLFA